MLLSHSGPILDAASSSAVTSDGRWAGRQSVRIAGEISSPQLSSPVACIVRDTSSSGARVELTGSRNAFSAGTERIPVNVTLLMPMDRMQVDCTVVWRKGTMMGLRYTSPARALAKKVLARVGPPKAPETGLLGKFFK